MYAESSHDDWTFSSAFGVDAGWGHEVETRGGGHKDRPPTREARDCLAPARVSGMDWSQDDLGAGFRVLTHVREEGLTSGESTFLPGREA